ncbi:GFA family protein [Alphaproteobacteria bacterium]|nr:GFA family protein [Alphaproteobacteria bacterium]
MSDEIRVNGKCHCGNITIKAQVKLSEVRACHCTDCQKMSGAPLRAIALAPADKITINGTPKEYIKVGDSGNKRIQAFCQDCGTQLFATDIEKTVFNLRTGFLEQKNNLEPKTHVFTKSSMPWMKFYS